MGGRVLADSGEEVERGGFCDLTAAAKPRRTIRLAMQINERRCWLARVEAVSVSIIRLALAISGMRRRCLGRQTESVRGHSLTPRWLPVSTDIQWSDHHWRAAIRLSVFFTPITSVGLAGCCDHVADVLLRQATAAGAARAGFRRWTRLGDGQPGRYATGRGAHQFVQLLRVACGARGFFADCNEQFKLSVARLALVLENRHS